MTPPVNILGWLAAIIFDRNFEVFMIRFKYLIRVMAVLTITIILFTITDRKEKPKALETSKISNTKNSIMVKQVSRRSDKLILKAAIKQKIKAITPHKIVHKKNFRDIVSKQTFESLIKYNNDRKARVIMSGLSNILEGYFKNKKMITKIKSYFDFALKEIKFNSQIENTRMLMIDYLGDVILGNINFEREEEALTVLLNILKKDTITPEMDHRQKKSMIGDKMELMAYYTQFAEDQAYLYLQQEKGTPYFNYLKTGFVNGLYFKGLSKKDLKEKMADVEKL